MGFLVPASRQAGSELGEGRGIEREIGRTDAEWVMNFEHKESIEIKHALKGGELQVGHYFLDRYAVIQDQPMAFECYGCLFFCHGCPICYSESTINPVLD